MGKGHARMAAAMRAAVPAFGAGATLILAASAVAAGTSSAGPHPGSAVRRPHLVADVRGRRGLAVPLAPFAAGDVQQRTISLHARRRTTVMAAAVTVLAPDATSAPPGGFQVRVDRCSRPWSSAAAGGLRCRGRARMVLGWHPAQGPLGTHAIGGIRRGRTAWLRVSVRLPVTAGAGQEGRSIRLRYRFTAV
jgi:hypothetical protein